MSSTKPADTFDATPARAAQAALVRARQRERNGAALTLLGAYGGGLALAWSMFRLAPATHTPGDVAAVILTTLAIGYWLGSVLLYAPEIRRRLRGDSPDAWFLPAWFIVLSPRTSTKLMLGALVARLFTIWVVITCAMVVTPLSAVFRITKLVRTIRGANEALRALRGQSGAARSRSGLQAGASGGRQPPEQQP